MEWVKQIEGKQVALMNTDKVLEAVSEEKKQGFKLKNPVEAAVVYMLLDSLSVIIHG